ncbi:MAG: hypothetical protein CMI02_12445 [Oceanospirillaceae bacterium]|nr:hypothetical protein [Oceanospirillaceae bacterium]MBT12830.1 hypothetical protein [Oceanospirillaceae bacterium]|tara:strand:+ start:139146 stop:141431 length:2286 start_codon:yes stop_codon:yes gene_type:complete
MDQQTNGRSRVPTPQGYSVLSLALTVLVILMALFMLHNWNISRAASDGELRHISSVVQQGSRANMAMRHSNIINVAAQLDTVPDSRFIPEVQGILNNYMALMTGVVSVAYVSKQGDFQVQASRTEARQTQVYSNFMQAFDESEREHEVVDAPAYWDAAHQRWLLPLIYPVERPHAGYSGYLISMYDLGYRMEMWGRTHLSVDTQIAVVGTDALPRYSVPGIDRFHAPEGKAFLQNVIRQLRKRKETEGPITAGWPDGEGGTQFYRVYYAHLGDDLYSLVIRPVSVFYQAYWNNIQFALLLFSGLILCVIVLNHMVIRQHMRHRHELEYKAHHDPLTGLLNRSRMLQLINLDIEEQANQPLTLILINVDHFNRVNDQYGHSAGDRVLCDMACRINSLISAHDWLGRASGDEFMVLLRSGQNPSEQDVLIMALMAALNEGYRVDHRLVRVSVSVGVAAYPGDASEADQLLGKADAALHRAKSEGRAQVVHYSADIAHQQQREKRMMRALDGAWNRGEIYVVYQPQVDCVRGSVRGAEALVRWNSPEFGLVPPDEFIPLAESSGLVGDIDRYVMREACLFNRVMSDMHNQPLQISVNISAYHLLEPSLIPEITQLLSDVGLDPSRLVLEVTETAMLNDFERAAQQLSALRTLGIGVSVDDFGTGYSSLAYIHKLPVTEIKIDRSFVEKIDSDLHDRTLISAIIAMGRRLHLEVVAEGVETEEQWQILRQQKCDVLQGYHFSRPLSSEDFVEFVADHPRRAEATG